MMPGDDAQASSGPAHARVVRAPACRGPFALQRPHAVRDTVAAR